MHLQLFQSFNIGFRFGGSLFVYIVVLLLSGNNGKVAGGWDAIDGGVVCELPHHPTFETGRFEAAARAVTGNPDGVVLINLRGNPLTEKGVAGVDDRASPVVLFNNFEPDEQPAVELGIAASCMDGLHVKNRWQVLVADVPYRVDEVLRLLLRRL